MQNILVTGGAGYIGSHLCKALADAGYCPITYDNLVYGHRWAVQWGPLVVGDIADRQRLDQVLAEYKPIAVMHFAAYAYVGESVQNPGKYYRNNVVGSLTLLESMRDFGIALFIFSSTCATYGVPKSMPLNEAHPQAPINAYGESKLMVERMLRDFDTAHGIRFIALRYFNAAGADSAGQIGESHNPETHLIPLVLDAAARRTHISVFGDDYATSDGTCIRDYIHVTDLANAHVLSLQALLAGATSRAYNLGNGHGFSVFEVIETSRQVTNREIAVKIERRRAGDPSHLVGDAKRIRQELKWLPEYTDLANIIKTAWDWHQHPIDPVLEG